MQPEPRWGVHAALLGAVVLAGGVALARIEPASAKHEGAIGILVGFAEAMQVLGLTLGVLFSVGFYVVASTALLLLLRKRRRGLLWAHAGSALLLLLYLGVNHVNARARDEERRLREAQRLDAEAATQREREAAERRRCLLPSLTIHRKVAGWPEQPGARCRSDVSLVYRTDFCERSKPSAFRLRGHGRGWELAQVEGSLEATPAPHGIGTLLAGSFESSATEMDIERGDFTLDVRFDGHTEWLPYEPQSIDVSTEPDG